MQISATLIQKASNGDVNAQYELGRAYEYGGFDEFGEEVRADKKQAVEWYRKSAELGYAKAQSALASMYQYGHGVRKSQKQAFYWYKKSADQGCDSAQASLADLYRHGEGVAEDSEQAMFWYRKAAEQGAKEYQLKLADVLVDDAPHEAAHWYRLAAESNDAEAQFKLAELYEQGNGVPKNDQEAFYWYLKAEHLEAKETAWCGLFNNPRYEVGRCYAIGQGVQKDSDEALKRLLPIADPKLTEHLGLMPRAQVWVASVFADPEHARHDLVEAYLWLNLAASYVPKGQQLYADMSGESLAQYRDTLGARLSHAQLQSAQQRSIGLFVSPKAIEKRLRIR
jgi:TPR repeat protein